MSFTEGEQVGPYRIMEKLGRGGMATVFKAYHANLDRYVALKVMHPAFMADPNFLARFEREAKVVARLEHPNIIPIYDFSDHDGKPYLVMKFVEGETLKAKLNRKPLSPEEGIKTITAVGDALSYAHKSDILHRDVKPSNVMVATDEQIYLTDFGLARIASQGESTLSSDMMIGTPQYISPEQAMGKRDLDAGTDIYSFGVLIYELVVGQVPFISDTPFSIIHDHIYTPLPLPRSVNPSVPEVIERLLLKSLTKEREDRFETIDEMVSAFKQAIEGKPLPDVWVDPAAYTPPDTLQASAPDTAGSDAPTIAEPVPETVVKKKRRFRWWYIFPILIGLFLCVAIASSIGKDENGNLANTGLNNPPAGEVDDQPRPFQTNRPGQGPADQPPPLPTNRPGQGFTDPDEALQAALDRVEAEPDNPNAYLQLADAYIGMGMGEDAEEAFLTGEHLADGDPDYYELAGEMLASRELWLQALKQYITVMDLTGEAGNRGFQENFRQALYHASTDPGIQEMLFQSGTNSGFPLNPQLLLTARARYVLYYGNPDDALGALDNIPQDAPLIPEAHLVRAEILFELGHSDEAREIINNLIESPAPPWIKNIARDLLVKYP